jgi:fucose 4-O-acetylase-like acetyltransferase
MGQRVTLIDLAKGLTILLVVLGHVIIGLFDSHVYSGTWQSQLLVWVQAIYLFHMPVFFALSGYFFTACQSPSELLTRIKKRSISIGVPYAVFSLILVTLFKMGGNAVRNSADWNALLNIWQQPIGPLWFLYVLFGIIVANSVLSLVVKDIRIHLVVSLTLAVIANVWIIPIYAIQGILIWSPFFLLGAYFRKYPIKGSWQQLGTLIAIYLTYLVIWSFTNPTTRVNYDAPGLTGLVMILAIILAFMFFPQLSQKTQLGARFNVIGQQSLGIYLLHVPLVSFTRITLFHFGYQNILIHVIAGFVAGWYGSLLILKYMPLIDHVLYPLNFIPKKKKVSIHD